MYGVYDGGNGIGAKCGNHRMRMGASTCQYKLVGLQGDKNHYYCYQHISQLADSVGNMSILETLAIETSKGYYGSSQSLHFKTWVLKKATMC